MALVLAHGSLYDRARTLLLATRCNVAAVSNESSEKQRKGEQELITLIYIEKYFSARLNPCPADLFQLYFSSFEAGITNAIASFK